MVSHIEVSLPDKPCIPNNIGETLKGRQRQLWKEALFVQYDKSKIFSLPSDPEPIKFLPEGKKIPPFIN